MAVNASAFVSRRTISFLALFISPVICAQTALDFEGFPSLFVGKTAQAVVAADFDKDGSLDLAASSSDPENKVVLFLNNGNGAFPVTRDHAVDDSPGGSLFAADLDTDGDQDLGVVSYGSIYLFLKRPSPSFRKR